MLFPPINGDGSVNWTVLYLCGFILFWQFISFFIYYTLYLKERISFESSQLLSHKEKLNQYLSQQQKQNQFHHNRHAMDSHSINTESQEYQQLLDGDYTFCQLLKYKLRCKCCRKLSNCITLRKYQNSNSNDINIIDSKYQSTLQRYNLWIWAHILRVGFLFNALCDTFIQLTTQSVSENGKYIFFNDTLLFKNWNCRLNGSLRMIWVANSMMICS